MSPSPVGSGARAAGMADAFVAIADDATAASWNPAGLIQLERPEIALALSGNAVWEDFNAPFDPESEVSSESYAGALNFLSVTYPLPFQIGGRSGVVGLYLQQEYDLNREFSLPNGRHQPDLSIFSNLDFEQKGALNALTVAAAFEVTPRLSLGVGLNMYRDWGIADNGWTQEADRTDIANAITRVDFTQIKQKEEYRDFRGENVTLGLLWNINEKWNIGLRYDSKLDAKADYERELSSFSTSNFTGGIDPMFLDIQHESTQETRKLRFPATVALGVAKRINDRNTISMDISRTDWNDFWFKDNQGRTFSLVSAARLDDPFAEAPDFKPTYTVRAGYEHLFIPKVLDTELDQLWSVRCGVFYDEEPATAGPDQFWGVAAGVGLLANQRFNFDFAYQLRAGSEVNADFIRAIKDFTEDFVQHRFLLSTVIYF